MHLSERIFRGILPPSGKPLVAAVSGGADSLTLLGLLMDLGHRPIVAHVDHSLRPESEAEGERVAELAGSLGLDFVLSCEDVPRLAADRHLSVEEAARQSRYAALVRTAIRGWAKFIATGHTADDQAETVLMHFLRGSGLAGLKGMSPQSPISSLHLPIDPPPTGIFLLRPLLALSRADTEAYCAARGWTPTNDPSNADTKYLRNRLRHDLLPLLETYNPGIRRVLTRTASVLSADHAVLTGEIERVWEETVYSVEPAAVVLWREHLLDLPLAYQRGVLRRGLAHLRPDLRDFSFETVARALAFAESPSSTGKIDLAAGLGLWGRGQFLEIREWGFASSTESFPQVKESIRFLDAEGSLALGGGWSVQWRTTSAGAWGEVAAGRNADPWKAFLDGDVVGKEILLRPRKAGDHLQPLGMPTGNVKVSDLMTNLKVPPSARATWPLLVNAQDVLWVAGLRVNHLYRVSERTRRIMRVTFARF